MRLSSTFIRIPIGVRFHISDSQRVDFTFDTLTFAPQTKSEPDSGGFEFSRFSKNSLIVGFDSPGFSSLRL